MPLGRADIQDTLEKVIAPFIKDTLPKECIFYDQLSRNADVEVFNDNFYAPLRTGRSTGVVPISNDKSKLRTGNSTFDQANVSVKILTGTFDITDLAKSITQGKKLAVESQISRQTMDLKNDFKRSINRQSFSDGVGVIAEVAGSVGAGTLSVQLVSSSNDDGRTLDNYGTVNGDINPTKYLAVGMAIGIGTAAADAGTISSITGNTVVVTGGPAINANDAIYIIDGDEAAAGTQEIQGFRSAISSGTADYAAVPRSTPSWTPVIDSVSETLSVNAMEKAFLSAREYAETNDRYAWFMNKTPFKKFGNLLSAMRITPETVLLGGWKGVKFSLGVNNESNDVGVFLDYDTPDGYAMLVNLDTWTICQVDDMNWLDDGTLLRRTDYMTYQKVMRWYVNYLCNSPGANAALLRKTG
jgi:hypothetical protein